MPSFSSLKTSRPIENIMGTAKDSVLLVTFAGGKQARIRRDLVDVYPGKVEIPKWLDKRIFPIKES